MILEYKQESGSGTLSINQCGNVVSLVGNSNRHNCSIAMMFDSEQEAEASAIKLFKRKEGLVDFEFGVKPKTFISSEFDNRERIAEKILTMTKEEMLEYILEGKQHGKLDQTYPFFDKKLFENKVKYIHYPSGLHCGVYKSSLEDESTEEIRTQEIKLIPFTVSNHSSRIPCFAIVQSEPIDWERDIHSILFKNKHVIDKIIDAWKLYYMFTIEVYSYFMDFDITGIKIMVRGCKEPKYFKREIL